MRARATIPPAAARFEFVRADPAQPIALPNLFARVAPLEVDLGCGDGTFLVALAEANPGHNYLGIERMAGRVSAACRRIARHALTNARILRGEIAAIVATLLPAGSVARFHIMFPDPWPKRRHHDRRLINPPLLRALSVALQPGGEVLIATDHREYFDAILAAAAAENAFEITPSDATGPMPRSTFEERFVTAGNEVYRLTLGKVQEPHRPAP